MRVILSKEISHLSEQQIEELYEKYLNGEKNKDLVELYDIDINPNKLLGILPPIKHSKKLCPYCQISMFSKRRSKSATSWDIPPIECFNCSHVYHKPNIFGRPRSCRCAACTENARKLEQLAIQEAKQKVQLEYSLAASSCYPYSQLTFSQKLYLLTLFRMQTDESFTFIQALDDDRKLTRLSPTDQMDQEIIRGLFNSKVILVDPNSDIRAFSKEKDFKEFNFDKVQWVPNITINGIDRSGLDETFQYLYQDFLCFVQLVWRDEVLDILYKIAIEEVMQYVYLKSAELNFQFSAEKKAREVLAQLLHNFSVSEIYYFVKRAVENAHIYYSKGMSRGRTHAANTIPRKMLELGERASKENWNTYKFNRDSRAPRSAISAVFHDLVFQGEDDGFTKAPGSYWEKELFPRYFSLNDSSSSEVACRGCGSLAVAPRMNENKIIVECTDCSELSEYSRI